MTDSLIALFRQIRQCDVCASHLPLGPNPVIRGSAKARVLIIGQAPGTKVHATSIPWNDPSGDRLRDWLGVNKDTFYDENNIAIMPMGLCYPGRGKSGDLPPRVECAPKWHQPVLNQMPDIKLTLLIGQYAQNYYLGKSQMNLTQRVQNWQDYRPRYWVLPHPSPRNNIWLKRNPWFERELLPELRTSFQQALKKAL